MDHICNDCQLMYYDNGILKCMADKCQHKKGLSEEHCGDCRHAIRDTGVWRGGLKRTATYEIIGCTMGHNEPVISEGDGGCEDWGQCREGNGNE